MPQQNFLGDCSEVSSQSCVILPQKIKESWSRDRILCKRSWGKLRLGKTAPHC